MSKPIPFVKASACGNDFLIVESALVESGAMSALTHEMCDRHNGIGADGVEWLSPADDADIAARLINADGSEAEISGNGTRCVAGAYLSWNPSGRQAAIRTGAGIKQCTLTARHDRELEFETAMGKPQIVGELPLRLQDAEVSGLRLSMGNPHYVIL